MVEMGQFNYLDKIKVDLMVMTEQLRQRPIPQSQAVREKISEINSELDELILELQEGPDGFTDA